MSLILSSTLKSLRSNNFLPTSIIQSHGFSSWSMVITRSSVGQFPPRPPRAVTAPSGFTVTRRDADADSDMNTKSGSESVTSVTSATSASSPSIALSGDSKKNDNESSTKSGGKRKTGTATVFGFLFGFLTSGALGYYYLMEDVNKSARSLRRKMDELQTTTEKVALSLQRINTIERELQSLSKSVASADELRLLQHAFEAKSSALESALSKHKMEVYETHKNVFQLLNKKLAEPTQTPSSTPSTTTPSSPSPSPRSDSAASPEVVAAAPVVIPSA